MKKFYLLIIAVFLIQLAWAQEINPDRTTINYFYDAEAFMYENNYDAALELLLKLEEIDPKNPNVWYKIGFCYLNTRLYKTKAQEYLEKAVEYANPEYKADNHRETNSPLESYLYLAIAYRMNYEFELSLQALNDLKMKLNPADVGDKLLLDLLDREEEITNNAIKYFSNPVDAQLRNLGPKINSEFADHSPIIDLNENYLIFTSKRPRDGQSIENQDEDIFVSKNNNYVWQAPTRLGEPVNTIENNEAAIGISIDGKQMFFFRSGNINQGNIFVTESEDVYNWSDPKLLREDVNSKYRETHATITPDGNSIFFTSNRKGGFGGSDIYVMRRLPNDKWSEPQILPKQINSEYDEESPYVHPDGVTLFFSSKGHATMGGYDVFYSIMSKDGAFSEPVNLGYPINTPDDDVSYVMNMDGRRGYIATVKEDGFGDLDLYEILQSGVYDNNLVVYDGIVSDINNNIPEDLIIAVRDAKTGDYLGVYRPNKKDGRYLLVLLPDNNYEISYEAAGHLLHSIEHTPTKDDVDEFSNNFLPIELDPVLLQAYLMHDFVYFNEGDVKLDDEAVKILDKVIAKDKEWETNAAKMIVNLNLPIVGADPIKDKARADAITSYLRSKGLKDDNIYLNGSYPQGYNDVYGLDMRERKEVLTINQLPIDTDTPGEKITINIDNILFDFDRYDIKSIYYKNLDILAAYMNDNPSAQIEVGGHTDWFGSNEYNYLLSYRRSKAVKDYLVAKGNSPENIITVKYGEDKPIAANQTPDGRDNPTGRKFNRRAEFKVITQGSVNLLAVNSLNIDGSNLNNDNNNTNPIDINNTTDVSNLPLSKRYTIQIFALKNQKPVDFFSDLVGVKMHVSDDGWYRYYVGDFNSYDEAKIAVDNLKELGYKPFIRKLSFFQK
jgi:outer membrane protein OmpA-like peptidoglycan-associated protein/tetratricopeptide (TPR) repeat protein